MERRKPTRAEIEHARELINELKLDLDWYDLEHMSMSQIWQLIDQLRAERRRRDESES